jgi:uncharacterized protein YdeI (YjbR/CyaY-like superfamily)
MTFMSRTSRARVQAPGVELPLCPATIAGWRRWLRTHHGRDAGVWVRLAKKGTRPGVRYLEALEEALCWGWIDGKMHRQDDRYFAQWFSPRRPRSIWSRANRRAAERLTAEGRMLPAGLAKVAEAKRSGRWATAYASAAPPGMTADVHRALQDAGVLGAWHGLAPSRRLQLLYWINEAKRPETRIRRIAGLPTLVRENRLPGFAAS